LALLSVLVVPAPALTRVRRGTGAENTSKSSNALRTVRAGTWDSAARVGTGVDRSGSSDAGVATAVDCGCGTGGDEKLKPDF
jgi:hypothetical protein